MGYTIEKLSTNKVKISFGVAAEEFDSALQRAYLKLRPRISLPGFRKGKAPRKLIEGMYGDGYFYEEAFDLIFPGLYREAVDQEELTPVDRPEITLDQIGAGQELKFTAEVFVRPEVSLGEYRGLKAVRHLPPVTEEEINRRIEQDVRKSTVEQDITDEPAQKGDWVKIDFLGTVDDEPFEGGDDEGYSLRLGSGSFVGGFEEQVEGMRPGEEKDITVTFPENYADESLAGKEAVFHVKVHAIRRELRPELNDEFAADVSVHDSFEKYREAIVEELTALRDKDAETRLENNLVQQAVDASDCDIPEAMVEDEVDEMLHSLERRLAYMGMQYSRYLKVTEQTEEEVREQYRDNARARVKTRLVLEEIRKKEEVRADAEVVEKFIAEAARGAGRDPEEFAAGLSEGQRDYFEEMAAAQKVIGILKESAQVTDSEAEPVSAADVMEQVRDALPDAEEEEQQDG